MFRQVIGEKDEDEASAIIRVTYERVEKRFLRFVERMHDAGWNTNEGQLLTGSPKAILLSAREDNSTLSGEAEGDEKKRV
jgi:hypothetical protein